MKFWTPKQGKFAHIYIPRYVYIPKDVFHKSSIQLELDTTSYTAFWRQLREAQQMINNMIDHEQLRNLYKTGHRKMLKGQLAKTIRSSRLEMNKQYVDTQQYVFAQIYILIIRTNFIKYYILL